MTREEMDRLIARVVSGGGISFARISISEWDHLFDLARIGARVCAPSDEEVKALAQAHFRQERIGPEKPLTWADLCEPCQQRLCCNMRAALSAMVKI